MSADTLYARRTAVGASQTTLARRSGYSRRHIMRLEADGGREYGDKLDRALLELELEFENTVDALSTAREFEDGIPIFSADGSFAPTREEWAGKLGIEPRSLTPSMWNRAAVRASERSGRGIVGLS